MLLEKGATPRLTFEKAQKEYKALEAESKNLDAVAEAADERISSVSRDWTQLARLLENKSDRCGSGRKERVGSGDVLSPVNGIVVARRGQAGDQVHPSMTDLFQIASDLSVMHAVAEASPSSSRGQAGPACDVLMAEMGGEILQGAVAKVEGGKVIVEFASPNP